MTRRATLVMVTLLVLGGVAACQADDIHEAAKQGDVEKVGELSDKGVDVSATGATTPLHEAAEHGFPEIVQLLINEGVNVNAPNEDSQTPLQLAVTHNRDEIARLLREHGAQE